MSVEEDYAIVREMLLTFGREDWDVDDARHALQRIWYVLLRHGLADQHALSVAIRELAE